PRSSAPVRPGPSCAADPDARRARSRRRPGRSARPGTTRRRRRRRTIATAPWCASARRSAWPCRDLFPRRPAAPARQRAHPARRRRQAAPMLADVGWCPRTLWPPYRRPPPPSPTLDRAATGCRCRGLSSCSFEVSGSPCASELEAGGEGVGRIEHVLADTGHPGAAGDGRDDRVVLADRGGADQAAGEPAADERLVDEVG